MRKEILQMILSALFIALVATATKVIQIPVPGTQGYIHLGDSMIFLVAILFGKRHGAIAGGIGSAFADYLGGYGQYMLFTLIIKGIMGYIVGYIVQKDHTKVVSFMNGLALILGSIWMIAGYYLAEFILTKNFTAAATTIPGNMLQSFGGAVLFIPIASGMKKIKYLNQFIAR